MRIIAVDPGYDRLGIAILEKKDKEKVIFSECFETSKNDLFENRLFAVGTRFLDLIEMYKPDAVVIEGLFFSKNAKTALKVSEVRGVLIFQAVKSELKVYEFTPNQIKTAVTGYGLAKKNDVYFMVSKILKDDSLINKRDDEIDAIAVGLTYFASPNAFL
jgi:crossover junction endodeoxyribonuclease RuvC